MMNKTPLEQLLAISLGHKDSLDAPLSREQWEDLLKTVKDQALVGVTMCALDKLEGAQKAPLAIYSRWALMTEKIERKNAAARARLVELTTLFENASMRTSLLKGLGVAQLYPDPKRRQCGDLDVWVDAPREQVVSFLRERYELGKIVYHHCDVHMFKDIEVEVHFTPSWMNNFGLNRILQSFFETSKEAQFRNWLNGICTPTVEFNAVFLLVHIFRHLLDEGIGLRQVLDYYYTLKALDPKSRESVLSTLDSLGLKEFTQALMYVLQSFFGLEDVFLLCAPDTEAGEFLLSEILRAGNFGKADDRISRKDGESMMAHSLRKITRSGRFLGSYSKEVLSSPTFMLWQYFWRRKNNYLYKGR